MKTIRQTWKRSLATLALFATLSPEATTSLQAQPQRAAPSEESALKSPTPRAVLPAPGGRYGMRARYGPRLAQALPVAPATTQTAKPEPEPEVPSIYQKMDPRLLERYGLLRPGSANTSAATSSAQPNRGKQQVEAKLDQIVLGEVVYDGVPLSEVLRDLGEQARKRDPAHQGINFLISNTPEGPAPTGSIDPTTGQPIPAPTTDASSVPIKLRLRDVRLKDVLDAMTRVTEPPIRYSVEEYGVIFSPGASPLPAIRPMEPPLQARTFHVDTNTFLAGLESAFGISVPHPAAPPPSSPAIRVAELKVRQAQEALARATTLHDQKAVSEQELQRAKDNLDLAKAELDVTRAKEPTDRPASAREVQQALRELLQQLGIKMDGNKAVFYNDLTGIVMVRATADDLQVVQAAIETLGGNALAQSSAAAEGPDLMLRRYGPDRFGR